MKLWQKVLIAFGLGLIAGGIFRVLGVPADYFKPIGSIFLDLIHMIIVLLVLSSMTIGITSIHDPQKLGRVGLKTMLVYLATTALAIVLGIALAKMFQPGSGLNLKASGQVITTGSFSIKEILLSVVPRNPIAAMAEENVLQIIVFSIFLGIAINFAGEKGKPVQNFLESLADVMYRLTSIVMEFSPIGVFALMTSLVIDFGWQVLVPLAEFILLYYFACLVHFLVVFCGILKFLARLSPWMFIKGMGDAIVFAFSTSSSSATLPVTMHCVQKNLGVSKNITSFVLPLGSTVNMNGAAIYQGMSALFIAQAYGIELTWPNLLTIVVTATLSAIGAAGIPGSGFVMLQIVFSSVGLPLEGMQFLFGIDRIREMASTAMNVMGDAVCAVYVGKLEGELDERQYNHDELVEVEGGEF